MKIKMLVMDVDGTLTDGRIYVGASGELMKAFDAKDGYGIVNLSKYSIVPVIITGRKSEIVFNRANELKIAEIYQEIDDKLECLKTIIDKYNICPEEVAYIGDDMNDLECIKFCGISACPNDAFKDIKPYVNYICENNGGQGAVREFIYYIAEQNE